MDALIERIASEMESQAITHTALARDAGVGRPYLYRVLAREQIPRLDWLEKVYACLGLELFVRRAR